MDRLLSDMDLVELFCMDCDNSLECKAKAEPCDGMEFAEIAAAAQLAKSDKEWVEELEEHYMTPDGRIIITPQKWQSRRKEIGL